MRYSELKIIDGNEIRLRTETTDEYIRFTNDDCFKANEISYNM